MKEKIGIIGGTGIQNSALLGENAQDITVNTPYGSVHLLQGELGGKEIYFINRHGYDKAHTILPHCVNYQANIFAFSTLGVERIIGTAAVGSLRADFPPGSLGLLGQFMDFTKGRKSSFYQGTLLEQGKFVDMTYPYCQELNRAFLSAGEKLGIPLTKDLVYICTEGPRFETAAEIKAFALLGGEVVGMTSATEAILCRELGICYGSLAMSMNAAAGMAEDGVEDIVCFDMGQLEEKIVALLTAVIAALPTVRQCHCQKWSQGV
ncbi:MAG: MTAP family purine nucleoside phosphorylase [Peptococcaceae bacterium]|jgi:5'-methylthioadenosine phosphorylase|nr:MTAP family purine nucleoside phosphorylase [Peptococcaceae bacterium]